MLLIVLVCLLIGATLGQNSSLPGPCVCATPVDLTGGFYSLATGRDYPPSSCPMLTGGLCCDKAGEDAISVELDILSSLFNVPPDCLSELTTLLCTVNCFQSTSLFSTFTPVFNDTTNLTHYQRTIYISSQSADTVWNACSTFASDSLNTSAVDFFLDLFGGLVERNASMSSYPELDPFSTDYVWVVNNSMGGVEITPDTISTGPVCANDSYVPAPDSGVVVPAPEMDSPAPDGGLDVPAPEENSGSPAPDGGDAPAPDGSSDSPAPANPPTNPPTTPPVNPPSSTSGSVIVEMSYFFAASLLFLVM